MTSQSPAPHHHGWSPRIIVFAALCAFVASLVFGEDLFAQTPPNFRIPPYALPDVESDEADGETLPDGTAPLRRVIVDTDPGVDDAAALIWLFSQRFYPVDVKGIVAVAGNTTVDQGVNNAQMILEWLAVNTPVVRGADGPLVQPPSLVPALIHGLDGLWFMGGGAADPDFGDATAFYCSVLEPGMLVIALGPLTNIAKAMDEPNGGCPAKWNGVEIVSLGGSRAKPNQTPVTEYNYWQDPEAAKQVLALGPTSGATIQVVLSDAFSQFEISPSDLRQLDRRGVAAIQNLLPALTVYADGLSAGGEAPTLPDPSAVIYALANRFGRSQSALVEVLAGPGIPEVARGQTIIGLTMNERITMIATDAELSEIAFKVFTDPAFDFAAALGSILFSRPDNAMVVTDINARQMHNIFIQGVSGRGKHRNGGAAEQSDASSFEHQMYVPLIAD